MNRREVFKVKNHISMGCYWSQVVWVRVMDEEIMLKGANWKN